MTHLLGSLCWFLGIVFYGVACTLLGYHKGLKRGLNILLGDLDWWRDAEEEVDRARMKIWREEEPKSGRWM